MSRGKYLSLEEARNAGKLESVRQEHFQQRRQLPISNPADPSATKKPRIAAGLFDF